METARLNRVRKAYEQISDQIRDEIFRGTLTPGERLPTELELAKTFGVSRPTVREALRVLASENLVRTAKGPNGGTFIILPSIDHVSAFLGSSINLLANADQVTLAEVLDMRTLLEVHAARLAANQHTAEQLERLRETVRDNELENDEDMRWAKGWGFHQVLSQIADNTLLSISLQPVFAVLSTNMLRSRASRNRGMRSELRTIERGHADLIQAIEAGDPDAAEHEMRKHLNELYPLYERAWEDWIKERDTTRANE